MNLEKFGNFIKELRKEKGLKQEELAEELNVHRTTVVKWEQGKSLPLNDTLVILSKYFNVTVDELLAGGRINDEATIEEKNKVTLSLLKSRRKSIRISMYFAIITFILFIIFLIYYFFTTYNSIHVYLLSGYNDNIKTKQSLLIVSNDKVYLRIGNIYNNANELVEVKSISLYVDEEYNTKLLFNGDPNELLIEKRKNMEIFYINKLKKRYNNLYLIVEYDNKEEIIKLEAVKDFENKSLIQLLFRNTNENYIENNFEIKLSDKFVYDDATDAYKLKDGNVEIECFDDSFICRVFVENNKTIIKYEFDRYANRLYYQIVEDNLIIKKINIGFNSKLNKNEQKIYKDFKEKILDKYLS